MILLFRWLYGRTKVELPDGRQRYLDIGNPPVEFDGYEQYLPTYYFNFTNEDVFESTSSQLFSYPILEGQELLLRDGINHPNCALLPPFSEEYDAPILGRLPSGEWLQYTPTIKLRNNGPEINDAPGSSSSKVLHDGGGATFIQTGEKVKCANVPRNIFNEETCFLSTDALTCSSSNTVGEINIPMNTSNIKSFYELSDRYVYAIKGLENEDLNQHPCVSVKS